MEGQMDGPPERQLEWLRRRREPVAIVLLIVSGIRLLIGIAAVPVLSGQEAYQSFATAAMFEAGRTFDVLLVLATALAAASCLLGPATPRARGLGTAALVETALAILVALGYGVMGLGSRSVGRGIEFAYLLLGLVLPVLAVVGLLAALRHFAGAAGASAQLDRRHSDQLDPVRPEPQQPAAWQPEQATGRVWYTAGDAARGAPGSGWPPSGESAGWQPIPGPYQNDNPPEQPPRP